MSRDKRHRCPTCGAPVQLVNGTLRFLPLPAEPAGETGLREAPSLRECLRILLDVKEDEVDKWADRIIAADARTLRAALAATTPGGEGEG